MIWMVFGNSIYPVRSPQHLHQLQRLHPNGEFYEGTKAIALPSKEPKPSRFRRKGKKTA